MRTWRTFAGVCWTGKRFDFDGGAQEVLGRGRNPPVTALPCQPPLGKGAKGTGDADCHTSDIGHWFAMTRFLQGVQWAGDRKGRPYGGLQEVPACGPMWASAPTEGCKKLVRYRAGGVEPRPYGWATSSAVGQETGRVAPAERGEFIILIFRKERCVWS